MYHNRMERIFRRYGIPCFSDYRRPMTSHPAAEAISALLSVFRTRWSHEALFRLLKSDLFPISRHDVDDLENYCLAYGIQGYHWLSGKTWNYGRRHEGQAIIEEREEAQLQRIQDICQAVRDILMPAWEEAQDVHISRLVYLAVPMAADARCSGGLAAGRKTMKPQGRPKPEKNTNRCGSASWTFSRKSSTSAATM